MMKVQKNLPEHVKVEIFTYICNLFRTTVCCGTVVEIDY